MSSISESEAPLIGAKAINALASDWLQRQQFWDWSANDQVALDTWLADSLAHRTAYWRVRSAWERSERLTALRRPVRADRASRTSWLLKGVAIALAVIAVIIGGGVASILLGSQGTVYTTPLGGHEIITLADGSQVELNTNTSLKVNFTADRRIVSLIRGEAYFQIIHDAAHPFVVMVAGNRVTDIGTRFLIRNEANRVEVTLVEGRARFDSVQMGKTVQSRLLSLGDVLLATSDTVSVTRKSVLQIDDHLGWRQGVLVFDHTTLADAAEEFNRYNSGKLVIETSAAARLTIDGTFPINGVKAFIRVTNAVFGLRVETRGGDTVISR